MRSGFERRLKPGTGVQIAFVAGRSDDDGRFPLPQGKRWVKGLVPVCLMLLMASSLLAACGGGFATSSPTAVVTDFQETGLPADIADILLSGPTSVDIKPSLAALLADSNIDLVCAVSYGPTSEWLDSHRHGHACGWSQQP
jgi:hypothetical protein